MHAIRIHATGGPEALRWEELDAGRPGPGEALVRHVAVGLDFIDVYFRTGLYPAPGLPFVPGMEAAGVVEAVGPGVAAVAVGDRVAYAGRPMGAYCEARCMPAERLVVLPEGVDERMAAAAMLKGMTAQYLLRRTFPVVEGTALLVHAAAGGVGSLLCQWAARLGALVIGTVGTDAKAERARADGCAHTVVYTREDFVARVRELTGGAGVDVVYDSVGAATFTGSLDCLRPLGTMVCFGQSSGPVPPLGLGELASRGSLFLTRPSLLDYTATRADLLASAGELLGLLAEGALRVHVGAEYPLREAARAHEALEARATSGSTLLLP